MKRYFTHIHWLLLTLMVGLSSLTAVAQQTFPVVARFTQLPPYPVYLADFSNPAQTNLSIQVQQNDREIASRPFRIRIYVEGNGFLIQSTDVVQGETPRTLAFGQIYNLTPNEVANYFKQYNLKISEQQYRQPFNEGSFRFGVEIIDDQTKRPLSGIQWANPVWITINEPPVWVIPQASQTTMTPTTPQNITFQWAPRHTNVNDVEYEFTITEIMVNQGFQGNIQNLFLAQPAFYKTRTRNLTLNYNATNLPLVPGRTYAYRVQAIAKRGREDVGVFRNNGFSEIQHFKYGEKDPDVKPPTNLKIARNETNTGASFDWKGEPNHKNFIVEYKEKGTDKWTTANVKATPNSPYNSYFIPNLDEKKNYEIRVGGINEANKSAYSAPIALAAVTNPVKNEQEIAIQGTVQWAYFASEEKVKVNEKIIDQATSSTVPTRDIKHNNFEQQKGSRKYLLENAIVTLFSSEDANITNQNVREKLGNIKRIETVSSDANGLFKFKAMNIKLLADVKNLYVLTTYKGEVFNVEVTKITVPTNPAETKVLEPITILANSLRFSPKILLEQMVRTTNMVLKKPKFIPWRMTTEEVRVPVTGMMPIEGSLTPENTEEIALYRLQKTIAQNPYLKDEGNVEGNRQVIKYNNDAYVKVADFTNTSTSAQLFYNKAYNDSFIFRIKQKERDEVIYPVNNIEAFQQAKYAHVTDYFKYKPATLKIKGYVERKGKTKTDRMANVAVQALGTTVRTNASGYFEIEIPLSTEKGAKITLSAVDPLNTSNKATDSATYEYTNIYRTLVFKDNAHFVSSIVYDGYTRKPLGGAMVTYKGNTVKTDSAGRFSFVFDGEKMDDNVTVKAAGYTEQKVEAKDFPTENIGGNTDSEKKEEWLRSLVTNKTLRTTLGKNAAAAQFGPALLKEFGAFYDANYTKLERNPSGNFIKDSVLLNSEVTFRILTLVDKQKALGLRDLSDSATYVESTLKIDDVVYGVAFGGIEKDKKLGRNVPFGGYFAKTLKKTINIAVVNPDSTKQMYVEEKLTLTMPTKVKKDSIYTFSIRLKPAQYLNGIVYDSTMFIKGVHKDDDKTVNRPGDSLIVLKGATVSVVKGGSAVSNEKGFFRLLVPVGQEVALEITKKGYAPTSTTWNPKSYKPSDNKNFRPPFYIVQTDTVNIPTFKTLLGFDVKIDRSVINSNVGNVKTFLISGKIFLNKGKAKSANIFTADKTTELTFKNIVVKSQDDDKNKTNAVTLLTSVNLVETEAQIKLFGYAPITLKGNHAGEPFVRLNHLLGKAGEGKIGASEMDFTQKTMMGISFGDMKLKLKEPEKDNAVFKFNDKVSKEKGESKLYKEQVDLKDKLAAEKEEKTKAKKTAAEDAKATLAALQKTEKEVRKSGTAEDKKTMSEMVADQKKKAADTKYEADGATKVPEKEPLMLAFATSELEELRDDKEFSIIFAKQTNKEKNDKEKNRGGTEKTGLDASDDHIEFTLGSVDLTSLGVGKVKTSAIGVSVIKVLVEKSSAVLKKSGVGMKGNLKFPQIWKFKTDKPLIIDKLDIDKAFTLKQVTFVKGDKGSIYEFGMADKWMFYINNFQIYNNFKGYGIGGTFNTDKDNYLNVKSLGLTVAKGSVYPNVELTTPEGGVRFGNLRFKTLGKKSISFKRNIDDDSYEVETSLRIEYDESAVVSSATDTTNKFGKKLSDVKISENKANAANKSFEEEQAALKTKKEALKKVEGDVKKIEDEIDKQRVALSKEEDALGAVEQSLVVRRASLMKLPKKTDSEQAEFKTKEAQIATDLADAKRKREDLNARWDKWGDLKRTKEEEIEKLKANAINPAGATATTTATAAAATPNKEAPKTDAAKKDDGSKTWKDRLFPLTVQLFQWSTSGKLLVSASLTEDGIDIGVGKIKIRRVVYSKSTNPKTQVKMSVLNDLLKMTEQEAAKLSSTTNFNDANMALEDGKQVGVFAKDEQKKRDAVTSGGLSVKALSDKVAATDPQVGWALGFAGGFELTNSVKGLKFDSDFSMIWSEWKNSSGRDTSAFQINEIMLKLDGTGYRVMGKVKLATSGTKTGFEGAVDFETVKRKFAASFKFYRINDPVAKKYGIELGAAIQASTMIPMGSITWTSIGGGFELNTADQKYKVFFIGSAVSTGTPEKVVALKNVTVSVEFDGKACSGWPVIKGSLDLWTNDEEFCKVSVEQDFCKWRLIAKASCKKELAKTMVQLNALIVLSKAGFFAGTIVEAEIFKMKANGILAIGVLCNTASPDMPVELADYKRKLPDYLFQSDNVTFSGIYIGIELGKEIKDQGNFKIGPVKLASYFIDLRIKGAASVGVNFSNGNFMIKAGVDMSLEAKVKLLALEINGMLKLGLKIEGGYLNTIGWNFLAQTYGNLQVYTSNGSSIACNDYRLREYEWKWVCVNKPFLRKCRQYGWKEVPRTWYPTEFQFKWCANWNFGVRYRDRGPEQGFAFVK